MIFIVIFLILANLTHAQDFDIPLRITDKQHSITLWFGLDPSGTEGFDASLDTLAPPPPPGGFDARFRNAGLDYFADIRSNVASEKQFHLLYSAETSDTPIVLRWNSSNLDPLCDFFIVDDITGSLWGPLDMRITDSLTITDPLILSSCRILVRPTSAMTITINLTAMIEGFFNGVTMVSDTVNLYLRQSVSPYSKVDSARLVLDDSGRGICRFYNAPAGTYYLEMSHRNSIETWSRIGGELLIKGSTANYSFTDSSNQAYGNNMKLKNGKWCIYSGDVNQDGIVDLSDISITDIDNLNFVTGYTSTDVNGDGIVDVSDIALVDTNNLNFVSKITPATIILRKE